MPRSCLGGEGVGFAHLELTDALYVTIPKNFLRNVAAKKSVYNQGPFATKTSYKLTFSNSRVLLGFQVIPG